MTQKTKFRDGQRVIFDSPSRLEVGLSNPIEVTIDKVIPYDGFGNQLYFIAWLPTGSACVGESELTEIE